MKTDGRQEHPGSVNMLDGGNKACFSVSAKSPRTSTDQPETTGKHVLLSPVTDTVSPKPDSTEHWEFQRRKEDEALPIFLPLELHTHLCVALEEVHLNCSQTSQG